MYLCPPFFGKVHPAALSNWRLEKELELFSSRTLLDELAATGLSAEQMLRQYRRLITLVTARQLAQRISRDADDDAVLACALAARAELIVTGDEDLLVLKRFHDIPIITPSEAIKRVG